MFQIKYLDNSNGESYSILSQSGDNYLLLSQSEKQLILAVGWDDEMKAWARGQYYQNTPENFAIATQELMRVSNPEKFYKELLGHLRRIPYADVFHALIEFEDPMFDGLSNVEFENIYDAWFENDYTASNLVNMEPVYDACAAVGVDITQVSKRKITGNRIFVDMDGVLAEYKPCRTMETLYSEGYFASLKPMEAVIDGLKEYMVTYPEDTVYILSAVLSDSPTAYAEKNEWLDRYFPVRPENRIFCPCGENKADFIPGGIKSTDVLLDDYTVNLLQWEKAGGKGIKVMNGINGTKGKWQGARLYADSSPQGLKADIENAFTGFSRNSERGYSL